MSSSVTVRTAAAGVLAALLVAGCGGGGSSSGTESYNVSVVVSGLSGTLGVELNGETLTFTADGTQTFSGMLQAGDIYADVTVVTQPATQYCVINSSTSTAGPNTTVDVTCAASTGGIWTGTGQNGDQYLAMSDESGDFWLLDTTNDANGDVYVYGGGLTASGTGANASVSGSDYGEALTGTYSDGTTYSSGMLDGTVDPRNTLTLTSTVTTTTPTVLPQTQLALTYNPLYSQGSSLTTVAGTYIEGTTTVTISSGGTLFAQDSSTDCVLNGTVEPRMSNYNLYTIQYTYSDCSSASGASDLNGTTFNGLGAFEPANGNTAAQLIAVEATSLTTGYSYYEVLNLTE